MPNVDVRELEKFSELAHQWWDPHGKFKPLHEINPLRLRHIDSVAHLAGRVVLDVGCGGGLLSEAIAAQGARVTGIDLSERSLQVARLHLLESGLEVEYLNVSAEAFATHRPHHYDVVTCMEMLEHVPDPASVVQACARLVKPGGLLFFATISRNLKSYLFAIVGAEYVLGLLPRGTHEYARFIRPSELAAMCRSADLEVEGVVGMTYNPLTREYALVPDASVNYILHCRAL